MSLIALFTSSCRRFWILSSIVMIYDFFSLVLMSSSAFWTWLAIWALFDVFLPVEMRKSLLAGPPRIEEPLLFRRRLSDPPGGAGRAKGLPL